MFYLFVSIKPKIKKFTLLIEKVAFQEKQYKICILFNIGFNRSFLKMKQYAQGEKYLFSSHLKKKTRWPKAGYLPLYGEHTLFDTGCRDCFK